MTHAPDRRHFLQAVPVALAGLVFGRAALAQTTQAKEAITVYKDPSCTCCHKWVEHMQANGFVATVTDGNMWPVKAPLQDSAGTRELSHDGRSAASSSKATSLPTT